MRIGARAWRRGLVVAVALGLALVAALAGAGAAGADGPPDGRWRKLGPPERLRELAFVDPTDQKLTCLGSTSARSLWKFERAGGGAWSEVPILGDLVPHGSVVGVLPDRAGRRLVAAGFTFVYDSLGVRSDTLRVWTLSLDGERRWVQLPVPGASPSFRHDSALALDEAGARLFLVGGGREPQPSLTRTDPLSTHGRGAGPGGSPSPDAPANHQILVGEVWELALDAGTAWREVVPAGDPLPGALGGRALFEPAEGRLVLVGASDTLSNGSDAGRIRALAVDGDRTWVTLLESSLVEQPVLWGVLAFDPANSSLVMLRPGHSFQPAESTLLVRADLREAGAVTAETMQGELGPYFRGRELGCFDASTRQLLVVGTGGRLPTGPSTGDHVDVWSVAVDGPPAWQEEFSSFAIDGLQTTAPLVLDPGRRRLVALEPREGGPFPGVYVMDAVAGRAWSHVPCIGPGPTQRREGAVVVFDPGRDRLLHFGGGQAGVEYGDLWELSFAFDPPRWRRILDGEEAPRPRRDASAIYDTRRHRMVLFGGYAGEGLADTWELDLAGPDPRWRRLAVRGVPPPGRWDHSAIYDPRRDAMIVFGGASGAAEAPGALRDTWVLSFVDGNAWLPAPLDGSSPVGRFGHGAAYDPVGDRVIVLGGRDATGVRFDNHALVLGAPSRWVDFYPEGSGLVGPVGLDLEYDAPGDRLLVAARGAPWSGAFRVSALEWDRDTTPRPDAPGAVAGLRILRVGPIPSSGEVGIAFEVPRTTTVRTRLFDVRGRLVRDLGTTSYSAGPHLVWWDGRGDAGPRAPDGVYFARIDVEGQTVTGKLVLMD